MKKILLFSILLISLFICGCDNNKKVVCSNKISKDGINIDVLMTGDFVSNKLNSLSLQYMMDLSGYSDSQIKTISDLDMCSSVESSMKEYVGDFKDCKQSIEEKKLVITAIFDISKLSNLDINSKTTSDEFINSLKKQDYTCK